MSSACDCPSKFIFSTAFILTSCALLRRLAAPGYQPNRSPGLRKRPRALNCGEVKQMSTVANVERKIRRVEGFRIRILHLRGADVRGDRSGLPQYSYHRAADSHITV